MRNCNKLFGLYWLQLVAVFAIGIYLAMFGRWQIETNLLTLLPSSTQTKNMALAEQALFQDKQRQIIVLISGENALIAYSMLQHGIEEIAQIKTVAFQQPSITDIALFYQPYRHNLISQYYNDNLNNTAALTDIVTRQLTQISNPFVSETLAFDPRLNLANYLQEELTKMGSIESFQGVPSVNLAEKRYLINQLQLEVDGFSLNKSEILSSKLLQLFNNIQATHQVELYYSGILFHTAASTSQAKMEISTFGLLSLVAVVLLIILVFRSLLPITVALIIIAIAIGYGVTALLILFDTIHLLTLVFAITLIGVVIDYCFHFFVYNKNKLSTNSSIKQNTLTKPLVLGFITTALGYAALFFSPLALLSQVAIFMVFGLLGALLTVLILLPRLTTLTRISLALTPLKLSAHCIQFFQHSMAKRNLLLGGVFISLLTLFVSKPITFNDDVRLLNSSPDWLLSNEANVSNILNYQKVKRIIVNAETPQKLLEQQELVIQQLLIEQPNLVIKSIAGLLPSIKQQQINFNKLKQADSAGHFVNAMAISGLPDPITEFKPLRFEQFTQSSLAALANVFIAQYAVPNAVTTSLSRQNNTEYALWLETSGEQLSPANLSWLNNTPNINIFDKAADVSVVLSLYRLEIVWLLMMAFLVVATILIVKYGVKAGFFATFVTISSALIALLVSQLITGHLNIFNLLAVLLILALAIDYVIFYQEHGLQDRTFLAIALSALSSALVFGILIFSTTPAVKSFGLTVMIGIIGVLILAPLSAPKKNNG